MTYQQYVDHVLADSPLLYWPLLTDGNDASGNGKHATLASGTDFVDTLPTQCRGGSAFDTPVGNTGAPFASYTGTLDTNAGNGLTVEFWLRYEGGSADGPRIYSDTGVNKFQFYIRSTMAARAGTSSSTGRLTLTPLSTAGIWYYYVFTQDASGSSRLYCNAELLAGGGPTTQTVGADFPDLKIDNMGTLRSGRWQHVAVFNKELSAARIAERYAIQAEDLYAFTSPDTSPAVFGTVGTPPPTTGQLWPRGNP
jgi:hypothetical protein